MYWYYPTGQGGGTGIVYMKIVSLTDTTLVIFLDSTTLFNTYLEEAMSQMTPQEQAALQQLLNQNPITRFGTQMTFSRVSAQNP